MTKALAIAENQVRAIIRAAQKEGARVEVKIGQAVIAVYPGDGRKNSPRIDKRKDFRL